MNEITLGIIALILVPLGAFFNYLWRKYFTTPYLTIELRRNGGQSSPIGYSNKTPLTPEGYLDASKAIQFFHLTWNMELIITNNSDNTAFFPKLNFKENNILLSDIETINELEPIKTGETKILNCKYIYIEEVGLGERTDLKDFPVQIKNLKILLGYQNGQRTKFYTLYTFLNKNNEQYKWRKPKNYST